MHVNCPQGFVGMMMLVKGNMSRDYIQLTDQNICTDGQALAALSLLKLAYTTLDLKLGYSQKCNIFRPTAVKTSGWI